MSIAKFIISLDCEMLWGVQCSGGVERYPYLRDGFESYYDTLLNLFDQYNIDATFAFVASMALTDKEFSECCHSLSTPQGYGLWLDKIENKSRQNALSWFNASLISKVVQAKQKHEIGSHTWTHIKFDADVVSSDVASIELLKSHSILSQCCGQSVKSFIFPGNHIAHLDQYQKSSYKIYRGKDEVWYQILPFKRFFHFLDQCFPVAPRGVGMRLDLYGNCYLPGSIMLFPYDGIRKYIPDCVRYIKIKRGIDKVIREGKIFHLWFHPWNLGGSKRMLHLLEKTLWYVAKKRSERQLEVSTMGMLV